MKTKTYITLICNIIICTLTINHSYATNLPIKLVNRNTTIFRNNNKLTGFNKAHKFVNPNPRAPIYPFTTSSRSYNTHNHLGKHAILLRINPTHNHRFKGRTSMNKWWLLGAAYAMKSNDDTNEFEEFCNALFNDNGKNNVEISQDHLNFAQGEDCIVLLGLPGVGKSTLASAMYVGAQNMEERTKPSKLDSEYKNTQQVIASKKPIKRAGITVFNIRAGTESVTKYPEVAELKRGNRHVILCDPPGFKDKQSFIKDLLNALAIGALLRKAKRVKICFLLSESSINNPDEQQKQLEEMLSCLYSIFKHATIKNRKKCIRLEAIAKIQLIFSQPIGQASKESLQSTLYHILKGQWNILGKGKDKAINKLLHRAMFVDPMDRASKFSDVDAYFYFWQTSKSQSTVEDLVKRLLEEEDHWFSPDDFRYPITKETITQFNSIIAKAKEFIVDLIIHQEKNEENNQKVEKFVKNLKKLNGYGLHGIDFEDYIKVIDLYKEKKIENNNKAKELKRKLEEAEKKRKEKLKQSMANKLIDSWLTAGQIAGKVINYALEALNETISDLKKKFQDQ